MGRPELGVYPMASAWPPRPGVVTVTMSPGQWDALLDVAYRLGHVLVELDDDERPVRAYRKPLD